jgi:type VI secretion system protein ImpG
LRVEALRSVTSTPARKILEGASVRGARFTVELDERSFSSRGDAFLFGAVIDELLAQHVTMNSFTELVTKLQPSQAEYAWAARNGQRPIA